MSNEPKIGGDCEHGYPCGTGCPHCEAASEMAASAGSDDFPDWHRISILHDGAEIMSVTLTRRRPENSNEMIRMIRELLAFMEAPDVPDMEVLGHKSTNDKVE